MTNIVDIAGLRFDRLLVLAREGSALPVKWRCRCDCGSETVVLSANIRKGHTRSCGCLMRETTGAIRLSHGASRTPTYEIWGGMLKRCRDLDHPNYGGRGIRVCDRWTSFPLFLADMGERPSSAHSIDRYPNNNGHYEPGNCRWATASEQGRNRRDTKVVTIDGEARSLQEWCERLGVPYVRTKSRLRRGWTPERALGVTK